MSAYMQSMPVMMSHVMNPHAMPHYGSPFAYVDPSAAYTHQPSNGAFFAPPAATDAAPPRADEANQAHGPSKATDSAKPKVPILVGVLGHAHTSYYVPPSRVRQLPPDLANFESLVLCPAFDPSMGANSCVMGQQCRMVHADIRGLPTVKVHVNYAWRTLDEVTYSRYPAGETLHVAPPNSRVPTDTMDSGCVLATRALQSKRRPLTHCAHYYFNRQCNLGAECRFVHAVFIDPNATSRRRAPAPVQLGRAKQPRNGTAASGHEQAADGASGGDALMAQQAQSEHSSPDKTATGGSATSDYSPASPKDSGVAPERDERAVVSPTATSG